MSMNLVTSDQKSLASFWQRKEGTWGIVLLAAAAVAGIGALNVFGPAILAALATGTAILGQAVMMTITGSVLFFLVWVLFFTNVPKMFSYWFKAMTRRLAGVFVAVYPIEIINEFISKMQTKRIEFKKNKEKIAGAKREVMESKKEADNEKKAAMNALKYATNAGNQMEANLQAQIIAQTSETLEKYLEPSLAQLDILYERLTRLDTVIDYKIRGMENQAKNLARQNRTSKTTKGALSSAWAILRGGDADQELYDMAVEYVVDDYRVTMGMVDDFMSSTEDVLNGFDMKTGQWKEAALEQLAELERKEQLLIQKTPEANMIVPTIVQPQQVPASNLSNKYF